MTRQADRLNWKTEDVVATFTAYCYGRDGDEPGVVEIRLESASADIDSATITVYRWREYDDGGAYESGETTTDRAQAVQAGRDYAEAQDEAPDVDDLIGQIVASGYFGPAAADEIRAVCVAATQYSQGYLLLAQGQLPSPIGVAWTTNGYLQEVEYITLDATYPSVEYAADALLCAISADAEE